MDCTDAEDTHPLREGCTPGKIGEGGALERGVFLGSRAPFARGSRVRTPQGVTSSPGYTGNG